MPPRALLSVSDKSGLDNLARGLVELGYELVSTGNTHRHLADAGIAATLVADVTGFPEIMDGRVKTLHPAIHGGLLARRDEPAHMAQLEAHSIAPFDLLVANLYPFVATAAREEAGFADVVEQIDIGGPAMIRAAAKNHQSVLVVVRPDRYAEVLDALRTGPVNESFRRSLAAEAFGHTAVYDSYISGWLGRETELAAPGHANFPVEIAVGGTLVQSLRYGENPHQSAAFYRRASTVGGLGGARQLQGVELSYNNIQDAAAALQLVAEYKEPAAAIIKHMNPCGLAVGADLADAYRRAYECDTTSAFGGVVAVNRVLDGATAELMTAIFLEVVIAPGYRPEAIELFAKRSKVRLLEVQPARAMWRDLDIRTVPGGFLVQTPDDRGFDRSACRVVSQRAPTEAEWEQLEFAWLAAKHVKSNAIVLARDFAAVGVGAGQMSRVEAVGIAVQRAGDRAAGTVLGSDAFFPFPDGVEAAVAAGVTAIIQPGGSMRDAEVIGAADAGGAAMVLTGERHFRH